MQYMRETRLERKGLLYNGAAESDSNRNFEVRKSINRGARKYINRRKRRERGRKSSLSGEYAEMVGIDDVYVGHMAERFVVGMLWVGDVDRKVGRLSHPGSQDA